MVGSMTPSRTVYLVDVDNTLLDNDHIRLTSRPTSSAGTVPPVAAGTGQFSTTYSLN